MALITSIMSQHNTCRSWQTYALLLLLWAGLRSVTAQSVDLETVAKAKPLVVTGGVGATTLFTSGIPDVAGPLNYFLRGNLNLNLYGSVSVPLNFNYSDRRVELSQGYSFNQFSISPSYKWARAYIGTNYMTFSPYTLNGHQFTGGGLELTPDKWRIQLMGGRLLRSQYTDTTNTGPTYRRMGYGFRADYNPGSYTIGLTMFKAYDVANTLPLLNRRFQNQVINPKDNMVVSLNFGTTLFHALQVNAEYSNSVITNDQATEYARVPLRTLAGLFMRGNATTQSYNAFKGNVNYNIAATNTIVGVGYERIDPGYSTLGGYYFVNDLANYTLNFSQQLLQGRLGIGGNMGYQKDDILKRKANSQSRMVGSLNANARISEDFNMGLNFSNFRSYRFLNDTYSQLVRVPGQIIDTLSYAMVSRTLGYNANKVLRKTETQESSLSFSASYIGSNNRRANVIDSTGTTNILNSSLTYTLGFPQQKAAVNASLTYFRNMLYSGTIQGVGPTVGLQKTFASGFNTTFNMSAISVTNTMGEASQDNSLALNAQVMANMRVGKSHNFSANAGLVRTGVNTYLNGNVGYNFTF